MYFPVLCMPCQVLASRSMLGSMLEGGMLVFCVECAVSMAQRRSLTACAVQWVLGALRCAVFAVSMANLALSHGLCSVGGWCACWAYYVHSSNGSGAIQGLSLAQHNTQGEHCS